MSIKHLLLGLLCISLPLIVAACTDASAPVVASESREAARSHESTTGVLEGDGPNAREGSDRHVPGTNLDHESNVGGNRE